MGLYLPHKWSQSLAAVPEWFRPSYLRSPCEYPVNLLFASLSLPSPLTSSCSSKGATHFLNQCIPPVGMDTPFPCPSFKGRYQALPATWGLGTCILPQHLWAEVSTVPAAAAPAGAGDHAPEHATTVAAVSQAAISMFPVPHANC